MTIMEHSEFDKGAAGVENDNWFNFTNDCPRSGKDVSSLDERATVSIARRSLITTDAVPLQHAESSYKLDSQRYSLTHKSTKQPQEVSERIYSVPEEECGYDPRKDAADYRGVWMSDAPSQYRQPVLDAPSQYRQPVLAAQAYQPVPYRTPRYRTQDDSRVNVYNFEHAHNLQIGPNSTMIVNVLPQSSATVTQPKPKKRYTITNSKKKISDSNIDMLSSHVGKKWKFLARKLAFHDGDIDRLEYDNQSYGLKEIIWKMLIEWRQRLADKATLCVMADALIEIKLYDVAQDLKEAG